MEIIQEYKGYFKNLTEINIQLSHADQSGSVAFGIENISDVLEGVFRTKINDSKYLFILLNPIIRPKSQDNTLDAILQGGFLILKSINIRNSDTDDITAANNEVGNIVIDFLIRMIDDSRSGSTFWQYGMNTIDNGDMDIEEMAFSSQNDGSFIGYKVIFSANVPLLECEDFTSRLSSSKWSDK